NAVGRPPNADPKAYADGIVRRASYRYPPLPPDPHTQTHLMLVGFMRSGTTLLENVLAAHPDIEAFEEIPALAASIQLLDREVTDNRIPPSIAIEARTRYYREIRRHSRKPSATFFIDKQPMNSAQINVSRHLFPDQKYIFAIRHPFDVALSCFR